MDTRRPSRGIFLQAGLEQTPSWTKPPGGSAVTAKQAGCRRGALRTTGFRGPAGLRSHRSRSSGCTCTQHTCRAHQELLQVPGDMDAAHRRPEDGRERSLRQWRGCRVTAEPRPEGEGRCACAPFPACLQEPEMRLEPPRHRPYLRESGIPSFLAFS